MTKTVIVNSSQDSAGINIRDRLLDNYPFQKVSRKFDTNPVYTLSDVILVTSNKHLVDVGKELDDSFDSDECRYVFISKHKAESQIPSLTVHFTGNFSSNDLGGRPREISRHLPSMMKKYAVALRSMRGTIPDRYNLTLEATHHGPTSLTNPVLFVELGSSEKEWQDKEAAVCVARALMESLRDVDVYEKIAIGLGGTHYSDKFNRILFESDMALSIIAPKYALDFVDGYLLSEALSKCGEKISIVALDMKGLGKSKKRIVSLVETLGLEILKV